MSQPRATALAVPLAILVSSCLTGCRDTPLGRAAAQGSVATVRTLLDAGADPNASSPLGITPLAAAARNDRIDVIDLLIDRGADPHRGSGVNGWTPLLHALHKNRIGAARRLMQTFTAPSAELDEALYMASGYAQTEAAQALLGLGADPRRTHGDGATALSAAVGGVFDIDVGYKGCAAHTETVRALLAADATLTLVGEAGERARASAKRHECTELLALIEGG